MSAFQMIMQEMQSVVIRFFVETVSSKGEPMMKTEEKDYLKSYQCRVILTFCGFSIING